MTRNLLLLALLTLSASSAVAQGRRGGDDRDGGDRGGGPGDFLQRMDANGNGMIDPEESQGRAGFFLRRIAEGNPDIDLSQPVPLEKLQAASNAARERWGMSRGDDNRDSGSDRGDSDRSGDSRSSNSSPSAKPAEPAVPGFGEASELPVVPGFGLMTKALAMIKITDADRQEAHRRFGYYDRDNNGVIEGDEMEQARSRGYDQYDSNQDGKLSLDEMAMRYARRRVEEEAAAKAAAVASSSSSSSSSRRDDDRERRDSGRSSSSSSRSSSSKSSSGKPYRIVDADERLAKKGLPNWFLDKDSDNDGQVAMVEYGKSWSESTLSEFAKYDLNSDGVITPEECLRASKSSGSSLASSSRYGSSRYGSSSSSSRSGDRGYGSRTEVARAEPPRTSSSTSKPAAAESAADESDDDEDEEADGESVGSGAAAPVAVASGDGAAGAATATAEPTTTSPATETPAKAPDDDEGATVDPRYLSYAEGRIKQVDANGDGMLQPDEWIKMSKSPAAADSNADKRITPHELALWFQKQ